MKVMILITNLDYGGVASYSIRCKEMLGLKYKDVYLVTFNNQRQIDDAIILSGRRLIDRLKNLRKFIKDKEISTIITSIDIAPLLVKLSSLFLKVQLISVVHTRLFLYKPKSKNKLKSVIWDIYMKLCFRISDKIVCVSKGLMEEVIEEMPTVIKKTQTIYNPIIKNLQNHEEKYVDIENKEKINLVTIGWINRLKNQKEILEAMKLLNDDRYVLNIVGGIIDEEYYEEMIHFINKNNLNKNVNFLGVTNNIKEVFKKSDICILSSKSEALPTVLIEALECSVPVISNNCKFGPSEILKGEEFGLLYTGGCTALYRKLKEIKNNQLYNEIIEKAQYRIKDFSYEIIVEEYTKIIKNLN